MNRKLHCLGGALAFAALGSLGTPALAASQRTFVALSGVDAGTCGAAAPCRTLAFALGQTQDGGEIVVLESGGYGPVTIATSVSIIAPDGVYGGITAFAGNAVTINSATANVAIKGFTLTGLGADNGVAVIAAASVRLENCTISGFNVDGIVAATGGGLLVVERTRVRDNKFRGIVVGGTYRLIVEDSTVEGNGTNASPYDGLTIQGSADVTIRNTRIVRNMYSNIRVNADAGDASRLEVTDSLLADGLGGSGLYLDASGAGASIYAIASRNVVRNNFHGLLASGNPGATIRLIATNNISTGHVGSWAYGAVGAGTTLVLSGNVASQSLWGVYNYNGESTILSTGDNIVQDAGVGATTTLPAQF